MALKDVLKRLVRLVHDPVTYPDAPDNGPQARRDTARAISDLSRQQGGI